MADVFIKAGTMTAIGDAIRAKTGSTEGILPADMPAQIEGISTGTDTSDATASADEIFAGETSYGADGKVTGTFTIDSELTEQNDLISQIASLVASKANPQGGTDTSDATATAEDILSGKTAYAKGEKITGTIVTKSSSNLTASGATVTVPAGYYASQATKSVSTGSAKTPATTVTKNPSISVSTSGLITASVSGTQSVTPTVTAGYVSSGTAGTITVSGSATKQLTTKAATTITPSTSSQTAVASGVYTTGAITVAGDANLVSSNIKSGVSIFGVNGTYEGSGSSSGGAASACTGLLSFDVPTPSGTLYFLNETFSTVVLPVTQSMVRQVINTVKGSFMVWVSSVVGADASMTTGAQIIYQAVDDSDNVINVLLVTDADFEIVFC